MMIKLNAPRLYSPSPLDLNHEFDLSVEQSHYLTKVMRQHLGDMIRLFNETHGEVSAKITLIGRNSVRVKIIELLRQAFKPTSLHIIFAVIKRHRLEAMLEKATELGATDFHAVVTRYTQQKMPKTDRLQRIVMEAAEQSERLDMPNLHPALSFDTFLKTWKARHPAIPILACIESGDHIPLFHQLNHSAKGQSCAVLIGPEGGFSPDEINQLNQYDFIHPVQLGPRILKADTAAITAISVIQAKIGDGDQKPPRNLNSLSSD